MKKLIIAGIILLSSIIHAPAEAQLGGRLVLEPYVAYGFFGDLPESPTKLEGDVAYGGRVAFQMSQQFALFVNGQRSTPLATGGFLGLGQREINVDHWSGGVEFSYVPRGGAEGMLPILLEAGLGQARYEGGPSDFAANVGIASALRLTPNFGIRYGVNDYISNFRDGNGVVNQIFVRVGAEVRL